MPTIWRRYRVDVIPQPIFQPLSGKFLRSKPLRGKRITWPHEGEGAPVFEHSRSAVRLQGGAEAKLIPSL
jgi:hypothetical protein